MTQRVNVIVSSYADGLIKESQPDAKFYTFITLQELAKYIEQQPIRAQRLYISREVLQPAVANSLTFITNLLDNPFFKIDDIYYITEAESDEIPTVRYLIEQLKLSNWHVICGALTREYVTSYISGSIKSDDTVQVRKAIYRVPKSEYIRREIHEEDNLDEEYISEEKMLSDIPEEINVDPLIIKVDNVCKNIVVTGISSLERTMFSFMLAQYLAFNGKTLIVERDYEYLTLTDMASKTEVPYLSVDVSELYRDTEASIREIKLYSGQLIILTCHHRAEFNYSFICNILYSNLCDILDYMVLEQTFDEIVTSGNYIVVMPNNIVDVLRTCQELPDNYEGHCKFVAINDRVINEMNILNTGALSGLLKEVLGAKYPIDTKILNFKSLTIGGEAHDLRMLIG